MFINQSLIVVLFLVLILPFLFINYLAFIKVGFIWKLVLLPIGGFMGLFIGLWGSICLAQIIVHCLIYAGKTPSEIKEINEPQSGAMAEGIGFLAIFGILSFIMLPLCLNLFTYLTARLFLLN